MAPTSRQNLHRIWFCDNCQSGQYWLSSVTEQCLECGHYRCFYCRVEHTQSQDDVESVSQTRDKTARPPAPSQIPQPPSRLRARRRLSSPDRDSVPKATPKPADSPRRRSKTTLDASDKPTGIPYSTPPSTRDRPRSPQENRLGEDSGPERAAFVESQSPLATWNDEGQKEAALLVRKTNLEAAIQRLLRPVAHLAPGSSAAVISSFVLRLARPRVPAGHARITWTCGCGKAMFADVEASDWTAHKLEAELRKCAGGSTTPGQASGISSHLPSNSTSIIASGCSSSTSASSAPAASPGGSATPRTTAPTPLSPTRNQTLDQRFLLLCVNGRDLVRLDHLLVNHGADDQALFQDIRRAYVTLRSRHERQFHPQTPVTIRKIVLAADSLWSSIQRAVIAVFEACHLKWLVWWIGESVFWVPMMAHLVRFELAPIKMDLCPLILEFPSLPPETEVRNGNYHYWPCPVSACTSLSPAMRVPYLHSLFEDGQHLDRFWTDRLPKKLRTRLDYPGSGGGGPVIGWGVHIVEGINRKALLALVDLVLIAGLFLAVVYSAVGGDVSGGFSISALITADMTLIVTVSIFLVSIEH